MHHGKAIYKLLELRNLVLDEEDRFVMGVFFYNLNDLINLMVTQTGEGLVENHDLGSETKDMASSSLFLLPRDRLAAISFLRWPSSIISIASLVLKRSRVVSGSENIRIERGLSSSS
jgi:hypothetical protein